ncbi:MAG TPA: sugar phosphate isomerase/epimerase [Mycobacteriales bacterium]|nr:sugar phosphate isomerase/epimerase [Mycobacteriales bacterium]
MTIRIGLQLYSVRETLAQDPWGTLERLSDTGFTALEAANHNAREDSGVGFGVAAGELRSTLDGLGMRIIGCHINPLDVEILPRVLDYQAELGNTQIGCDIEFYPLGDRDYVLRRAETFNTIGAFCRDRGMRFYYHNHFQEFQRIGANTVYELLLDNTDPALVQIEMDTYWMYRGGQDPLDWMRRYADRVILIHQKDFTANAAQPLNLFDGIVSPDEPITMEVFTENVDPLAFTEIGTGVLPIQDIIDTAQTLPNLDYLILEQDHTTYSEIESVRISKDAFSGYSGISW